MLYEVITRPARTPRSRLAFSPTTGRLIANTFPVLSHMPLKLSDKQKVLEQPEVRNNFV